MRRKTLSALGAYALTAALTAAALAGPLGVGPAAASTGSVMIAASQANGLYFDWQTDGTSGWNQELVASGSWYPPGFTVQSNGNDLIAAVNATTYALYFFWQQYGTSTWNAEQVSAPGTANAEPVSLAVQNPQSAGQPAVVAIVAANDVSDGNTPSFTYYYQNVGTSPWHSESLPGGYDGQTDPEVSVAPNNTILVTFAAGAITGTAATDGFWVDQQPYLSSSWSDLQINTGFATSNPQIVEQSSGNLIVAADNAESGGTDFFWSPADDLDSWYGETVSTAAGSGEYDGVDMADDPAESKIAVTAPNGSCDDVFLQAYGTSPWNSTQLACPGVDGVPQIAAESTGGLVATDENNNGQVTFSWQDGSGKWHPETVPGLTTVFAGAAVLGSYNP